MIIVLLYGLAIALFSIGLYKLPSSQKDTSLKPHQFSIVIPFRNEEKNLPDLLESLSQIDYPRACFEILMIDDQSTDHSTKLIQAYTEKIPNLTLLQNLRKSVSPKKDAIQVGLQYSSFEYFITSDADCIVPKHWLHFFNNAIHHHQAELICGPVVIHKTTGFWQGYQYLDLMALMGTTMGGFGWKKPMLCNAANMGFKKETYLQLQSQNPQTTTSGDDLFTLEAFAKNCPENIHYLNHPHAIVNTKAEFGIKEIVNQRIRWAAKSTRYKNRWTQLLGLLVLSTQIMMIILLFYSWKKAVFIWSFKILVDGILLACTCIRLKQVFTVGNYLPMAVLYPFLNSYIGLKALTGGYQWKGRKFKR